MLQKYGEALYDNIILLCPSVTAFGNGITNANFVDFVDNGGKCIIGAVNCGDMFILGIKFHYCETSLL